MLRDGLYEQVINKGLDTKLAISDKLSQTAPIDTAEASKVLAKYVAEVVERGLDNLRDNGGDLNDQVALANQIITTIQAETKEADFVSLSVAERAEQLLALFDRQNSIWTLDEKAQVIRPETSIAQSSLFTGCSSRAADVHGTQEGDRVLQSDRHAGVLHQVERAASHHG
jgi:hypothetical protein